MGLLLYIFCDLLTGTAANILLGSPYGLHGFRKSNSPGGAVLSSGPGGYDKARKSTSGVQARSDARPGDFPLLPAVFRRAGQFPSQGRPYPEPALRRQDRGRRSDHRRRRRQSVLPGRATDARATTPVILASTKNQKGSGALARISASAQPKTTAARSSSGCHGRGVRFAAWALWMRAVTRAMFPNLRPDPLPNG